MATRPKRKDPSLLNLREPASTLFGIGNADIVKRRNVVLWPEWSDADIAAEKWDGAAHAKTGAKDKGNKAAAVTPVQQVIHYFDDPEGKCELPPSLKVAEWKRPVEFITDKTPVVVDLENAESFDLMTPNSLVHESETMRWITSQISGLCKLSEIKLPEGMAPPTLDPTNFQESMLTHSWRPWEHIYASARQTKGGVPSINIPQYNGYGKYAVKLFFMGCWRKVIVDDTMPFDQNGNLLLPATNLQHELWPMLLTKALLKVAALDYSAGGTTCEFGDFSVIHCLTGWLPEIIRLPCDRRDEIWKLLKSALPEFTLPEPPSEELLDGVLRVSMDITSSKDDKAENRNDKQEKMDRVGRESKRDTKGILDKKKKGDKDEREKLKVIAIEEPAFPDHPEMVVFAVYHGVPKSPARITKKKEMADAFEALRQHGFSHCYPHPVLLTQTRSCPLQPPPPVEKIPAWKTVRPKKKPGEVDADQKEPDKPIQSVHITSPFMNYKMPFSASVTETDDARGEEQITDKQSATGVQPIPPSPVPDDQPVRHSIPKSPVKPSDDAKMEHNKKKKLRADAVKELPPELPPPSPKPDKRQQSSSKASKRMSVASSLKPTESKGTAETKGTTEAKGTTETKSVSKSAEAKKDNLTSADGVNGTDAGSTTEVKHLQQPEPVIETWMDFEVLCKSFKLLHVYHKPATYPFNHKQSDLKSTQLPVAAPPKGDKVKSVLGTVVTSPEDKSPFYLFVDNLKPTEIVVSFSALCRWNEVVPMKEEGGRQLPTKGAVRDKPDRAIDSRLSENPVIMPEMTMAVNDQLSQAAVTEPGLKEPLKPGLVIAEPFSWKSLSTGPPILQVHTTGTRATAFCLPEGRHVLRFTVTSPLGFHLQLASSVNFVFGDEEKIMNEQTKESLRFLEAATQVMHLLGNCLTTFGGDMTKYQMALQEFEACHCPYTTDAVLTKTKHTQVLMEAFYTSIKKVLSDAQLATPEMTYALRVFNFDCTTRNPLGIQYGTTSRPATSGDRAMSSMGKKAAAPKKREVAEAKMEHWKNREVSEADHRATTRIAACWRSYYVRKILRARIPGSEECVKVQELLTKAWSAIEPLAEACGSLLLRTMFRLHPQILPKFSFFQDEWSRITFVDYQGIFPDHPPNSWFVIFREVFHMVEEMLCVPKLSCSLSNCLLTVINNDTGEQVPRICAKVVPHFYTKNKRGYTFLAEAKSLSTPANSGGHWRLRLIGAANPLPVPMRAEICASFNVLELHDYYIPNDKDIILRYHVRVTEELLTTIKVDLSKSDVRFKLSVIDNDQEVAACEGRGLAILPAFIFLCDPTVDEEAVVPQRSISRSSTRLSRHRSSSAIRVPSAGRMSSANRHASRRGSLSVEPIPVSDAKPHKYFIQAVVLRKTWPLSRTQWAFIQSLKEKELDELKVFSSVSDSMQQPQTNVTTTQRTTVKSREKTTPAKSAGSSSSKAKEKQSLPTNADFNPSMPNWTLRIVTDADASECIEVKKDTDRADEIRALKLAWEAAEPGRAAKAKQSRLNYLASHMIQCDGAGDEQTSGNAAVGIFEASSFSATNIATIPQMTVTSAAVDGNINVTSEDEGVLTNTPPPLAKKPTEMLAPLDVTPFLRKTCDAPRLLDEDEEERQMEQKRAEIAAWRECRAEILERRERELQQRNAFKKITLQVYEQMQIKRDEARAAVNERREAYRLRLLEEERKKQEEIAALEAALKAEQEKNNPTPKGQKAAKSQSGKKK
jgi:hypothetical protein